MTWSPESWKNFPIKQQPTYPDQDVLGGVRAKLESMPPLVFEDEIVKLRKGLAEVAEGRGFLLQGGDCAESFSEFSEEHIQQMVQVMLQMAVTLTYAGQCHVLKIGRMAGQFAKPRSADMEEIDGVSLPSYRGDSVNGIEFAAEARVPDPQRLLDSYHQSAVTMNLLRALTRGGFASLRNVKEWNLAAMAGGPLGEKYGEMAERIHESLDFIEACGLPIEAFASLQGTALYTSHEALLLDYEEAMLREHEGKWYDLSAHFLWIGERTRQLDHAHVEFLRGVENPIGVKIGPAATADDVSAMMDKLDPDKEPGKLVFITRVGAEGAYEKLKSLFERVELSGRKVVWVCDPMHGNTVKASSGLKTRKFESVVSEIQAFFKAHKAVGTWPGGVHLEMTGRNVTECTGGAYALSDEDLLECYDTQCDPRLNAAQSLEVAFLVAEELKGLRG
ncbi:phospho-2-dehydro-3-deoxyheptonate aldolase [Rubritalea halochordaticola]|uniref:Phospho-2-dehydro-3-deoxyheptonate aldolase n=1 Tax=Rubritalea halochordaticola TaxID=714537 RepID=A0ABP9V0N2_9BACT